MLKKIKNFFHKLKEKNLKYWRDMDVERELKIEQIKTSRTKRNFIDYLGIGLVVIWFFVVIPFGYFIMSKVDFDVIHKEANAEEINISNMAYEDILNDTTALVNFNQQVSNEYINGNYNVSNNPIDIVFSSNIVVGHKYYIRFNINSISTMRGNAFFFANNSEVIDFQYIYLVNDLGTSDFLVTAEYNTYMTRLNVNMSWSNNICIDVSAMFGVGNEPSLEECQHLFVADYYSYNTGTTISLSGLNSYAQGYNDASSSYTTITTSYDSYAQIFDAGTSYFVKQSNNNGTSFTGRVGFYLGFTAQAGTSLDITLNYFLVHNTADLQIGYIASGSFVPLFSNIRDVWEAHSSGLGYTANIHLSLPVSISYLYLYSNVASISDNPACILGSYSITYTYFDLQSAVIDAERNGYTRAENLYKSKLAQYTDPTGTGYTSIYQQGYTAGMNSTSEEFALQYYTFPQFIGAIFDVPVRVLNSLLDFDVLGYNMKNLIFSILTISIVLSIVRFILQKSGGE